MSADNARCWAFGASNYVSGPGRPVRLSVNRNLRSGKLDFVALTDDEALELATELLDALRRSRAAGDQSTREDA